jgi:hypothetical protein
MPSKQHHTKVIEPTWEIPESQADLRLDDVSRDAVQQTGPLPTVSAASTTDAVKIVGGAGGILGLLALVDKLVQGSGLTADELVKQLGPALGVLYTASPMVVAIICVGWFVLRGYRNEQAAHRRRDRRLQKALIGFGQAIKDEIGKLRQDVAGFTAELGHVKQHVENRIVTEVGAAARAATHRADQTDSAIASLRAEQAQLGQRVAHIEQLSSIPTPVPPRRDGVPSQSRRKRPLHDT